MAKTMQTMKRVGEFILCKMVGFLLSLRYRIVVIGKEGLTEEKLSKKSGILFLANHTAEIDPVILLSVLWFPFRVHPVAVDYLFQQPVVRFLLKIVKALPIPSFDTASNSFKQKQITKTYEKIFSFLDQKENLLLYPAGFLKKGPLEIIGGASGVHSILQKRPNVNVVLVRTTGLWGSSFSKAPTGKTPQLSKVFAKGFKILLRNFIFFTPKRSVSIELMPVPEDFPWKGGRRELNRYLENWYNAKGPEPLNLISFSHFRAEFPTINEQAVQEEVSLDTVPEETKKIVLEEIARLSRMPQEEISINSHLAQDLGLDSLDIAQLVFFLKDTFGITELHASELSTVGSVLAFAAKLKTGKIEEEDEVEKKKDMWEKETQRPASQYPEGETIPEVFLRTCDRMGYSIACVDAIAGSMTYLRLKIGIILLSKAIRKLPGDRIGIMMPASVAVNAMVLAVIFAGKVPVMINWTLGARNINSIVKQSNITTTLSSWQFLNRLDNVELNGIDDQIVLLEDLRKNFTLFDKIRAYFLSRKKTKSLLKICGLQDVKSEDTAAILFTSGTESYPKGVPLSHKNLIENQRGAYKIAQFKSSDVCLGALPPFHSFGFSVTGLLPLLAGVRVAYSPNPTDGRRIAEAIERWKVTLVCLAPTFLKNLLRVSTEQQLKSLRLVVAGAEKTAAEMYEKLGKLNPQALLIEGYGITECAPVLTINPPDKPPQGVGVPLPDVEITVVHPETLHPVPRGESGLILARGPNIFKGYLDPALSSPFVCVDEKLWYQTGDLGYLNEGNYLTLSGRFKRFVKIGGEMVSLTAIEEVLQQKALQKGWKLDSEQPSLAVYAFEVEGKKSEIHLFTTFDATVDEANQILRESGMSNIIKIRAVKKVLFIPLLGSGKIDYRRLSGVTNGR